jgi:hypothetical protein
MASGAESVRVVDLVGIIVVEQRADEDPRGEEVLRCGVEETCVREVMEARAAPEAIGERAAGPRRCRGRGRKAQ